MKSMQLAAIAAVAVIVVAAAAAVVLMDNGDDESGGGYAVDTLKSGLAAGDFIEYDTTIQVGTAEATETVSRAQVVSVGSAGVTVKETIGSTESTETVTADEFREGISLPEDEKILLERSSETVVRSTAFGERECYRYTGTIDGESYIVFAGKDNDILYYAMITGVTSSGAVSIEMELSYTSMFDLAGQSTGSVRGSAVQGDYILHTVTTQYTYQSETRQDAAVSRYVVDSVSGDELTVTHLDDDEETTSAMTFGEFLENLVMSDEELSLLTQGGQTSVSTAYGTKTCDRYTGTLYGMSVVVLIDPSTGVVYQMTMTGTVSGESITVVMSLSSTSMFA